MNTANRITMVRVLMIPAFLIVLYADFRYADYIALALFIVASVTDAVDGYIARNYNQVTTFGKFMDPLADKLLVVAAILFFVERGQMPAWAALLVVTREFAVTALRLVAVDGGRVIAAGLSGKIKTASSLVCICIMLTPLASLVIGSVSVNTLAVAVIVITTVWSGISYFIQNKDLLNWKS